MVHVEESDHAEIIPPGKKRYTMNVSVEIEVEVSIDGAGEVKALRAEYADVVRAAVRQHKSWCRTYYHATTVRRPRD